MDLNELIKQLENVSLFELWRLNTVISKLLENPAKNRAIRNALSPGMEIFYFEKNENRMIPATIITVNKTRVLVLNKEDGKRWDIPFYMLNLENIECKIVTTLRSGLSKINFKVSDTVGFTSSKIGKEVFGKIVKLNPKFARIILADGKLWNVPYSMLFPVIDGHINKTTGVLIEGEVL